jgi:hypothetical protein
MYKTLQMLTSKQRNRMLHTADYATIKLAMPKSQVDATTPQTKGTQHDIVYLAQTKTQARVINNTHENI